MMIMMMNMIMIRKSSRERILAAKLVGTAWAHV